MTCYHGQGFGHNYNPSYKSGGLKGHTGVDINCGYGTPITADFPMTVYKVLTPDNPSNDGSGFTGVFGIVDDGIQCFEWLVGHCKPSVVPGAVLSPTDVVGTEANHGTVYSGNVQITLEMQKAGDQRGSHRHYQKRPLKKTKDFILGRRYITGQDGTAYRDQQGFFYEVWDYDNGFNGCVDYAAPIFSRDLYIGRTGYDVACLQRKLGVEDTGFFGRLTFAAVQKYQKANGVPATGYVGKLTRAKLN